MKHDGRIVGLATCMALIIGCEMLLFSVTLSMLLVLIVFDTLLMVAVVNVLLMS